ncbi:MAG: HlyD family efflux transporter periplasmic adaptor subunit [Bacteroidia bacterium]
MPTLHNDDVEEILSRPPSWMVRWGLTTIFLFLFLLLFGAYFINYPDTISGSIILTTQKPPINLHANSSARIDSILVLDGDVVLPGQKLLILESYARSKDVYSLDSILDSLLVFGNDSMPDLHSLKALIFRRLQLGEIQSNYTELSSIISDFLAYSKTEDFIKKQRSLLDQKSILEKIVERNSFQNSTLTKGMDIAARKFQMDSTLFSKQVISLQEYNTSKATLLDKQYSYSSTTTNFFQTQMQLATLNKDISDLEISHDERIAIFISSIQKKCNQLKDAISSWELINVLKSPVKGRVHLLGLTQNQSLKIGADALTIIPENAGEMIAFIKVATAGAAKVKPGQKVIIQFTNYPSEIFGKVYGVVKSISLLPKDSAYLVEVTLSSGLKTTSNHVLEYMPSMTGIAEIVTEKITLFDRLIGVFRKSVIIL